MAELRIKVGAYLDTSFDRVFRTVEGASQRQGRSVARDAKVASDAVGKSAKESASVFVQSFKEQEKAAKSAAKEQQRAQTEASKALAREWKEEADAFLRQQKLKARAAKDVAKEIQADFGAAMSGFNATGRSFEKNYNAVRNSQRKAGIDNRRALVNSVGSGIATGLDLSSRAAHFGLGILGATAQGAGVDLSLQSQVAKNVSLESGAVKVSNSGFIAGDAGPNGRRIDPNDLAAQARTIGRANALDPNDVMGGLEKFTGLSGDLDTARGVMGDLARLSKATGTDLEDMAAAAGNLDMELGDIPNKGERISQIMRAIAGQGKLGAVEISDLASQMAKIAASAGRFEGDVGQNVVLLGAFAQEARQRGGAASATQAATSVQGLINTLVTPARVAAFQKQGIRVTNSQGLVRNPEEILVESLRKVGDSPTAFKALFANVQGARAVEGFATLYRQAGGGQAGEDAVRSEMKRLKEIAMGEGEVAESFKRAMETAGSQAQIFNDDLAKVTNEGLKAITPALEALAPIFLDLARDGASLVKSLSGKDADDESKQKLSDEVLNANVDSETSALNRAGLRGKPIRESVLDAAQEDEEALEQEIARKKAAFAKDRPQLEGFQGGANGPVTQQRIDEIHSLEQRRDDLKGVIAHVKGELLDGFRILQNGVLTVRIDSSSPVVPVLGPNGIVPANAPEDFAP